MSVPVVVNENLKIFVVIPASPATPTIKTKKERGILSRHYTLVMIVLVGSAMICAATAVILAILGLVGSKEPSYIVTTTEESIVTTSMPQPIIHYTFNKSQWGGKDPLNVRKIDVPVKLLVVKHTNTVMCQNITSCIQAMRDMQNHDMGVNKFPDIQYNFVIGGDGNIYEGRGWGVKNEQMNNTIDVAYMGDFNVNVPSQWQISTGKYFVTRAMLNVHLDPFELKMVCHNQTEDTDSPGENLYREIVKWQFYSHEIINESYNKKNQNLKFKKLYR